LSERYLLSGANLGLIKALAKQRDIKELIRVVDEIIEHQHLFNSSDELLEDIITIERKVLGKNNTSKDKK